MEIETSSGRAPSRVVLSASISLVILIWAINFIAAKVGLRSLPATGLTQVPAAAGAVLYRHGIEVTASGDYFKMLGYLSDLERNPAKILWGAMDLQASYPKVTLKITLYTLSPEKTWLLI